MPTKIHSEILWISEQEMRARIRDGDMPKHDRPTFYCCLDPNGNRIQIHPPIDPKKFAIRVVEK